MYKRIALLAAVLLAVAGVSGAAARPTGSNAQTKPAAKKMMIGLYDEAQTLYGNPDKAFPILKQLRVQVLRTNLYWGHAEFGVARRRPANASDPDDPAYDWGIYDRVTQYANQYRIKVVFSIWGTPKWANGGRAPNRAPLKASDLQKFAFAAAKRYSGKFRGDDDRRLPRVSMWLAWNEPNNPSFLFPQYRRVAGGWTIESARQYAKICNAVYAGVKSALRSNRVACGVTGPRGNNIPNRARPSVSPLAFLRASKAAGMKRFDVYAHHPYYGRASEEPGKSPPAARGAEPTAITLGNINTLLKEVTRLYGGKKLWITEYGYQTNPPDRQFGVSRAQQARFLKQAFAIAKKNPRIEMMLWFLLRDEPIIEGWQSGLMTARGVRKPAYNAFRSVTRAAIFPLPPPPPVTENRRPTIAVLGIRFRGVRVYARVRICDDSRRNVTIIERDSRVGVRSVTRRFATVTPPRPCGVYTRSWTPGPRFRARPGRYLVTLWARDAFGLLSAPARKTFFR